MAINLANFYTLIENGLTREHKLWIWTERGLKGQTFVICMALKSKQRDVIFVYNNSIWKSVFNRLLIKFNYTQLFVSHLENLPGVPSKSGKFYVKA